MNAATTEARRPMRTREPGNRKWSRRRRGRRAGATAPRTDRGVVRSCQEASAAIGSSATVTAEEARLRPDSREADRHGSFDMPSRWYVLQGRSLHNARCAVRRSELRLRDSGASRFAKVAPTPCASSMPISRTSNVRWILTGRPSSHGWYLHRSPGTEPCRKRVGAAPWATPSRPLAADGLRRP